MKLSNTQKNVLSRMANGWELGSSMTATGRSWLQLGGIGKGGATETISNATVVALQQRRLIDGAYSFPTRKYELTELGRQQIEGPTS